MGAVRGYGKFEPVYGIKLCRQGLKSSAGRNHNMYALFHSPAKILYGPRADLFILIQCGAVQVKGDHSYLFIFHYHPSKLKIRNCTF